LEKLPLEWNTSTNNWTFIYKHETTSDKYYINIVKMMNMLTINAMIIEVIFFFFFLAYFWFYKIFKYLMFNIKLKWL